MKSHRNNKKTRKHKNKKGGGFFSKKVHPIIKPKDNADLKAKVKDWVNGKKDNLGHISYWDTSDITDMSELFLRMTDFNENISSWDVSKVKNMESMFRGASKFNQPIGEWNVSNVTNMESMFYGASKFNQPIGKWDVSNVTNMGFMFYEASAFNQPIGEWNVLNVTNMIYMFYRASKFNQPLWDVSIRTNMRGMFDGATFFQDNNKPRIRLIGMSTKEFNTKCKSRDENGNVIDPITLANIDESTAVQIPGDTVHCYDRAALRIWVHENDENHETPNPLTRKPIPKDWISRNLVEGNWENTDQGGGKKRKTRKMKGKRSLRKAKKIR